MSLICKPSFNDNLAQLPEATSDKIDIIDGTQRIVATLENKPGQAGSLRVYQYLDQLFGKITPQAAYLGLAIYGEHTQDALDNPDKHPNIDRLFAVVTTGVVLYIKK